MKKTTQIILSLLLFIAISQKAGGMPQLSNFPPLDPSIRYGVLPNGLTYYIKSVEDNSSEVHLRLLMKAGIFQENSKQSSFAHILEHISVTGLEHSPLGKFSETAKMANLSYNDIIAYTSTEATVYGIKTTSGNKDAVEIGFRLFQDILWNMNFTTKSLNKERYSVLNEYESLNGGKSATSIFHFMENSITGFAGNPKETLEHHLMTFKESDLIKFYKKWYHPNLAAIVVIGNIKDIDATENTIKSKFSKGLPNNYTVNYNRKKKYLEYLTRKPQFLKKGYATLVGEMIQKVHFQFYFKQPKIKVSKHTETLDDRIAKILIKNLFNKRFNSLRQSYDIRYDVAANFLDHPLTALKINFSFTGKNKQTAFFNFALALKDLRINGFTEKEYKSEKNKLMQSLTNNEYHKNSYWIEEIQNHFIYGEPLPTNKKEKLHRILNGLQLKDINDKIASFLKVVPDDIALLAQENSEALTYTEDEIRDVFITINNSPIVPYSQERTPTFLLNSDIIENLIKVSYVEKEGLVPKSEEFIFKNGLRLVFVNSKPKNKSTTKKNMEVTIHGYTPKGAACYSKEDFFSAINSAKIVKNSGVGGLDKFEISRYNLENDFKGAIKPYVNFNESGIQSREISSLKALETALQYVYLFFTSPNKNNRAFEYWKYNASTAGRSNITELDMEDMIKNILGDVSYIPKGNTYIEGLRLTDLERSHYIYRELFRNPGEFTFLFTGSFPRDKVLSLCQKYLGNIPSHKSSNICKREDHTVKINRLEPFAKTFLRHKAMDAILVELVYARNRQKKRENWKEKIKLDFLGWNMTSYLYKNLRFESDNGTSYKPSTSSNSLISRPYNEFTIQFSSKNRHVNHLMNEAKRTVELFKKELINKDQFEISKQHLISIFKATKSYTLQQKVFNSYRYGCKWVAYDEQLEFIQNFTREKLRKTAQEVFKNEPFEFRAQPLNTPL